MLVMSFDPKSGWSAPVLQPYQPLQIDPAASCFQYSTNLFEGMKAYLGPDGEVRLFRPNLNMERMKMSAARIALPVCLVHRGIFAIEVLTRLRLSIQMNF